MDESMNAARIEVQNIDHLGIVAGIIDEIALVEQIDALLGGGRHPQEHVSPGRVVKAMILNGLGFVSAPLYLFEEFFSGKATQHLLGPGIDAEHLNDDRLGRVLDKLFEADLTNVFLSVAMQAIERFGVGTTSVHLDATSFYLHGQYNSEKEEPEAIRITHGYSRDHRPDLKQFVVDLMSTSDGGVPLFLRVADGNEADRATFAGLLKDFEEQLDLEALFVADSALYSAKALPALKRLSWLSRVPLTLKEAKTLLVETPEKAFAESTLFEGYRLAEATSEYGGVRQRWLIVHSEAGEKAANKRLEKKLIELDEQHQRRLKQLKGQSFHCEADAHRALDTFAEELEGGYHRLITTTGHQRRIVPIMSHEKPGRPRKEVEPEEVGYRIEEAGLLVRDEGVIEEARRRSGRFILASNVLDQQRLSNEQMLVEYKAQHDTLERGFRFLKDPLFFASSLF
jgi:transposase